MADRGKRREEANGIKTIDYELRASRIICQNKTLNWELHMYSVCHNCVVHRVPQLPCSMSECLIIKQNLGLEAISAPVCHNCVVHRVPLNFQPRAWRACTPNHLQIISQGARPSALSTPKFGKKIYLLLLPLMLWRTDRQKEREQVYLFPPCADISDGVCRYICLTYPHIVIS